jgi:drug/metabolite transporter (DMT)-like permease
VFQGWVILQAPDWWLLLLAGAIFTVALLGITQAYRIAAVSTVAPFEYVYILWASLVGYLIFADVPGPRTMIGGAVIVISGCYIILRERQQRGRIAVGVTG